MERDVLAHAVIGCAIDVHRALRPGLLESAYEKCLFYELQKKGIQCRAQVPVPITYRDIELDCGYRIDILVNDSLILELKAVDALTKVHEAQLLTYMKLSRKRTGLLINFNVDRLVRGVRRFVL
ncbi:MAG TPA: GxxExxY protein [Sedimenticola thiotaurini]|uniref:GxxExxY protein n=1 Tax=Sedimenticola thiotaurini TaxID=1543721 RepID=A0A831RMQ4_9GAMM|nr:GxxExxY protein [Sedimenticola thiotaurini]